MASNKRGRLKERFEGVHRNFDWSLRHLEASLALIGDQNPKLTEAIVSLHKGIIVLDELAQGIYIKL